MEYREETIEEFTAALAGREAVPGGGGASALVGALGIALGNMVGALTVGKAAYADVEEEMRAWSKEAGVLRRDLLLAMDEDAKAFLPLAEAYRVPKDDPARGRILEEALHTACEAPLVLMQKLCRAVELLEGFAAKGSRIAVSDAGVGAACCRAALLGAALNIRINTKSMADRALAASLNGQADAMLSEYVPRADKVYGDVAESLRGPDHGTAP